MFTLLSFKECNAIDGDSTQSCQTRLVILNERNGGLQGLLPSLPDQFAGLRACEGCHGSCRPSASSQSSYSAPCANMSVLFVHLALKGTFPPPSGPSFGFISAVMLGSSPSRRCSLHGAKCREGQRGFLQELISCAGNGPATAPREQSE